MTSPAEKLVDASVRCGKCGAPGVGTCQCWITLVCPRCPATLTVERMEIDPPDAVKIEVQCPKCDQGDFGESHYFDFAGRLIFNR